MKSIGIPGWSVGENSFGVTKAYMEYFSQWGHVYILPPTKTIIKGLDLIVLPGGKDTPSQRYGEIPSYFNSDSDLHKEFFFDNNLDAYIKAGIPIFGICLGHQMLNVWGGGSIVQNCYHKYSEKSRSEKVHEVFFPKKFEKMKKDLEISGKFEVNSLHHQGVEVRGLSDQFDAVLLADPSDGELAVVEAMIHKTLPIASVQWHPEEIYDSFCASIVPYVMGLKKSKSTVKEKLTNVEGS